MVEEDVIHRAVQLIGKYDLPVRLRDDLPVESLMAAARKDKKARAGSLRYIALERIGQAVTIDNVPEDVVEKLWSSVL